MESATAAVNAAGAQRVQPPTHRRSPSAASGWRAAARRPPKPGGISRAASADTARTARAASAAAAKNISLRSECRRRPYRRVGDPVAAAAASSDGGADISSAPESIRNRRSIMSGKRGRLPVPVDGGASATAAAAFARARRIGSRSKTSEKRSNVSSTAAASATAAPSSASEASTPPHLDTSAHHRGAAAHAPPRCYTTVLL